MSKLSFSLLLLSLAAGSQAALFPTPLSDDGSFLHALLHTPLLANVSARTGTGVTVVTSFSLVFPDLYLAYGPSCLSYTTTYSTFGTRVVTSACASNSYQYWSIRSDGSIYNAATDTCLDVSGGASASTPNGVFLDAYPCNGQAGQIFSFVALAATGGNGFALKNTVSGLCVDGNDSIGAQLHLWQCYTSGEGGWNQWTIPSPAPAATVQYTAATYTNCGSYTSLNVPGFCGATADLATCEAVCSATPGCVAFKYAGRMNTVATSCPSNGVGFSWCMPLSSVTSSTCAYSGDIWDMYYAASSPSALSPPPPPPPRSPPPSPPPPASLTVSAIRTSASCSSNSGVTSSCAYRCSASYYATFFPDPSSPSTLSPAATVSGCVCFTGNAEYSGSPYFTFTDGETATVTLASGGCSASVLSSGCTAVYSLSPCTGGSGGVPVQSPPPPASSSDAAGSGLSGGKLTCLRALLEQLYSGNGVTQNGVGGGSATISDSTCGTCGKAGFCPISATGYADLNSALFVCASGGTTVTQDSVSVQLCQVAPGPGLISIVVILPRLRDRRLRGRLPGLPPPPRRRCSPGRHHPLLRGHDAHGHEPHGWGAGAGHSSEHGLHGGCPSPLLRHRPRPRSRPGLAPLRLARPQRAGRGGEAAARRGRRGRGGPALPLALRCGRPGPQRRTAQQTQRRYRRPAQVNRLTLAVPGAGEPRGARARQLALSCMRSYRFARQPSMKFKKHCVVCMRSRCSSACLRVWCVRMCCDVCCVLL